MKNIRDDAAFRDAESVMNELAKKKEMIDKEMDVLLAEISNGTQPDAVDPVQSALAMELGVSPPKSDRLAKTERYQVLMSQSNELGRAIRKQGDRVESARMHAGRRLFAEVGGPYRKAAKRLLTVVEELIAANAALEAEQRNLYQNGITEFPDGRFPAYGLWEQVPEWHRDVIELNRRMELVAKAYTGEQPA